MKYHLKWKVVNPPKTVEEQKKVWANNEKDVEKRKNEEKYGKVLFPPHQFNKWSGFVILDATEEQLYNRLSLTLGLEYEVKPIIANNDFRAYLE